MSIEKYPSIDFIRQCFRYDDGKLFWLRRPKDHFADERAWKIWNTRFADTEAGSLQSGGTRVSVGINGRTTLRYLIIWAIHHGEWNLGIDHENRNSLDDRLENLRIATHAQNCANKTMSVRNKSGYKGVSWDFEKCKWQVHVSRNGRSTFVGRFDDPVVAHEAYMEAAKKSFGEFATDGK